MSDSSIFSANSHESTGTVPSITSSVFVTAHPDNSHWEMIMHNCSLSSESKVASLFTSSLCFLWLCYLQKMLPKSLSINFSVCLSQARSLINKIMFGLVAKLQHQQSRIGRGTDIMGSGLDSVSQEECCDIYA